MLQLAAEADALADAEQHLAARLHQIADQFVDPLGTHRRAAVFSKQADVHRVRARELRASAMGEQTWWGKRLRRTFGAGGGERTGEQERDHMTA